MAETRDKEYRECAKKIWDKYRGKNRRRNSFNILWANTEILSPAVFNSTPKPDVRRRFKDEDPIGKKTAEALKRALEFTVDTEDFDGAIRFDVLDMVLCGRGVSRVRYVPSIARTAEDPSNADEADAEGEHGYRESVAWQRVCIEHVQWDQYRLGPGKTWSELDWIGFSHRMTREALVEKFGEKFGEGIVLDDTEAGADTRTEQSERELFRTALVWEIWDRADKKVRFISEGFKTKFLKVVPDPLSLQGFWPIPKPIYAISDSSCMQPLPLYEQYREQAIELDRVSIRINKLIDALKFRGIYDSTISCLSDVMKGEDNDLIPATDVSRFIESGFDKAIWFVPIEQASKVLQSLYLQRDATKQVIYELTGISDILRGATDPNETLGAQEIKAQSGSQRIQQMQRDVTRYVRDLTRMIGEIIGQQFDITTLKGMTGMQLPTNEEASMMAMQYQMKAQQAAQAGQQAPPFEPPVTWEQVIGVLRDDMARTFKIDIETDSTVAASIQQDMAGLRDVLTAVTQFVAGVAPAVQLGAFPVEAVKEIVMTICRRSKMGNAVEDALDKIQAPQPPAAPPGAEAVDPTLQFQHEQQMSQQTIAAKQQETAGQLQADGQKTAVEIQAKQQQAQMEAERDVMIEQAKLEAAKNSQQSAQLHDVEMERMRQEASEKLEILRAEIQQTADLMRMGHESAIKNAEHEQEAAAIPDHDSQTAEIRQLLEAMEGRRQDRVNVIADYFAGPRDTQALQKIIQQLRR